MAISDIDKYFYWGIATHLTFIDLKQFGLNLLRRIKVFQIGYCEASAMHQLLLIFMTLKSIMQMEDESKRVEVKEINQYSPLSGKD